MNRGGFALLAVLWLVTALTVLTGGALIVARIGEQTTRNRVLLARAGWAREACVEILLARYAQDPTVRRVDTVDLGRGTWCRAVLDDPSARLNVNVVERGTLERLLTVIGHQSSIIDSLSALRRRGPIYDLSQVPWIDSAYVTTRGTGAVNVNAAPREILATLPGIGEEAVQVILQRRPTRPIQGADELAGLLSKPGRTALLATYAEFVRSTVFMPPQFMALVEGGVRRTALSSARHAPTRTRARSSGGDPAGDRMRFGRRGLLRVRVGRALVRAEAHHRGVVTWAGEAGYDSLEDLTDTIARLAAEPAERCGRLAVVLERPPVQTRTLTDLPPVNTQELGALVAHQAARFFRKNGHPLVTDAAWAANGRGRVAHAAAIEEPVVAAIVAGARAAGLAIEGLAPLDSPAALMLLPPAERAVRAGAERRLLRRLGLASAAVWIGALGLFVGRPVLERRAIDKELAALAAPLAAVGAARRELRKADATLQAAAAIEGERGRSLELLGALAQALPDSAALSSLTWSAAGAGAVTGYARSAADVVARIERTRVVRAPRLDGPVIQETIAGREWQRFTIVFDEQPTP